MEFNQIIKLTPPEFERLIVELFKNLGYEDTPIKQAEDIGIDILAKNDLDSIAVQVKKYENRKINLAMIYHTYGAAAYYKCTRAVIVTISDLTPRAKDVANELNVEIWGRNALLDLLKGKEFPILETNYTELNNKNDWFYNLWRNHIKNLQGKQVKHISKDSSIFIVQVDNDGIIITNSNGRRRRFSIDIFRRVTTQLKNKKRLTRGEINQEYQRRGSSAICAVLANIPCVQRDLNAKSATLLWNEDVEE